MTHRRVQVGERQREGKEQRGRQRERGAHPGPPWEVCDRMLAYSPLQPAKGARREHTTSRNVRTRRSPRSRPQADRAEREGPVRRRLGASGAVQLPGHIGRALPKGGRREEMGGVIPHWAFYRAWPPAMTPGRIAKKV